MVRPMTTACSWGWEGDDGVHAMRPMTALMMVLVGSFVAGPTRHFLFFYYFFPADFWRVAEKMNVENVVPKNKIGVIFRKTLYFLLLLCFAVKSRKSPQHFTSQNTNSNSRHQQTNNHGFAGRSNYRARLDDRQKARQWSLWIRSRTCRASRSRQILLLLLLLGDQGRAVAPIQGHGQKAEEVPGGAECRPDTSRVHHAAKRGESDAREDGAGDKLHGRPSFVWGDYG